MFLSVAGLHAQTTASLSGTVTDPSGAVISGADVILTNDATSQQSATVTDAAGLFSLPALLPGTYSVNIKAKGFKSFEQHGIVLDASDVRKLPTSILTVGSAAETVTVEENAQIIPLESGERAAILDNEDINNLALGSRDLSELLKVLPGVTTTPNGLSNGPSFNFQSVSTGQGAFGNGLMVNGAPYRGGMAQLSDGVDINDPGCNCNSIALLNPDFVQEVSVETSNFGADSPYGPVIVSAISKSGTSQIHGEGYFYARNDVLNANDWQSDHQGVKKGSAHYYYPGGNAGGPIPFTHKKLLIWGGYERLLQNTGNANSLSSFIPTSDMLSGNFGPTAANAVFCQGASNINSSQTSGCNDLTGTTLPDGTKAGPGTANGSTIPAQFISPALKALSSFWPAANANPATTPGGYNYFQVIPGTHDGWIYRLRADYNLSDNTKAYISYQQGYDTAPSQGNGAHIYWTPYASIPFPGGGLYSTSYTKAVAGHFVHTFTPTLTNEFIASWGYGNFPVGPQNASAAFRSTLGYPNYPTVFNTGSKLIPSYNSGGYDTFPDFSEQDIFESGNGQYLVRKEMPAFADNMTKVWGKHTVKFGAYTENVGNIQASFESANGALNSFSLGGSTTTKNAVTGQVVGSPNNPTANFIMGLVTGYSENNSAPVSNMAYQVFAGYVDDVWKTSSRLTLDLGLRLDHLGHWYDRAQNGMAVWEPALVASDYAAGKPNPGVYWHAISPGVPNSGQPDRIAWLDPRIGVAYDIFGNGKSLVRGGWGIYRWADQYNDYTGQLTTAQGILSYGLPSNTSVFLNQFGSLTAPGTVCGPATPTTPACINGGVNADNPSNDQIPDTVSWNLTVSQQLPWRSLMEVGYVGSNSDNIVIGGQGISGGGFQAYTDVNKIPLGAFFKPDPVTGLTATNPENVTSTCAGAVCNSTADYHPYGKYYGNNNVYVLSTAGYANYHALQGSWVKRSSRASFNANYTWQKTLGTSGTENAFNLRQDYEVEQYNRNNVFNFSGSYSVGNMYHGDKLMSGVVNGWTISNITTFQTGGNIAANNNSNFGMSLQQCAAPLSGTNCPAPATGKSLSQATYYGTNASINVQPILTCNPTSSLGKQQRINATCFAPPPIGAYGKRDFPYTLAPYFDSDLALYKSFHTFESESVQFRIDAFDWLNHPQWQYSGGSQLNLHFNNLAGTNTFVQSTSQYPAGNINAFGTLDTKAGSPNQRILELAVKYMF